LRSLFVVAGLTAITAAPGCDPSASEIELTFDPCQAVELDIDGATDAQRASIDDALTMWRDRGTALTLAPHGGVAPRLTITFADAAEVFHGVYDPGSGVIHINTDLEDRRERAVTIAHELGHAFGLVHVERDQRTSVMNRGNLTTAPTDGDHREVEALWGGCAPRQVTP
jgi:hypothetical protein